MASGLALTFAVAVPPAKADAGFRRWISDFYATAAKNGISRSTYNRAFAGVTDPDPSVLEKAGSQPEFTTKIWDYLDSRVNPWTAGNGRDMARRYASTLAAIERRYGVDRSVVLAIWSMESNYGAILDDADRLHYVPQALATLAYADRSRASYARRQL